VLESSLHGRRSPSGSPVAHRAGSRSGSSRSAAVTVTRDFFIADIVGLRRATGPINREITADHQRRLDVRAGRTATGAPDSIPTERRRGQQT
jgi:hypothetical protein